MTAADPFWNPRPHPDAATKSRMAYFAGYSDGFHGYPFDAGDFGAFSDYRTGHNDGTKDAAARDAAEIASS